MEMTVRFPGGARVDAEYKGFVIPSDQPVRAGGAGSAPAPFDYIIASIGTCAGVYVHDFLEQRGIPSEDVRLVLSTTRNARTRMISDVRITVVVPDGFPKKYERAIVNAINLCPVKKHLSQPPSFTTVVETRVPEPAVS